MATVTESIPAQHTHSQSNEAGTRWLVVSGVVLLLAVLFLQLLFSSRQASITWDEDDHIFSGYESWKHGDFGLNPEHPPLLKMWATLPLLHMPLYVPTLQNRNFKIEAFLDGKAFLFKNNADDILNRVRLMASFVTVALALLVFLAAREMFGTWAGFIALFLVAFDPNILAHGPYVTTDVALTLGMFATVYAFYRYVKAPTLRRMVVTGIAAGFALSVKHTGILIFPTLVLLAICELWMDRSKSSEASAKGSAQASVGARAARLVLALIVISAVGITLLWACYGFRYRARPDGLELNPSLTEYMQNLKRPHEKEIVSLAARFHLLPESYLQGLVDVRGMSDFYQSYLFGKIYPHGVWYYFPAAFVIKSTVGFMALLLLALIAIALRKLKYWREILFLTVPCIFYLAIAMGSGMNIGVRHILPLYVFLSVLMAGAAVALIRADRRWLYAVAVLLVFHAVSSARAYPEYIPYSNELFGGPPNTHNLLSDSNADWGQQLKAVKKYLDAHNIKNCWFVYFAQGVVDPTYYGIPCKPLPTQDTQWVNEEMDVPAAIDGPVLISAGHLSGFEFGPGPLNPYEQFKHIQPAGVIQDAVFVFNGHFEIPLAAALEHAQKAGNLLAANRPADALTEAQQAVGLAPDAVKPNIALGDVLTALNRPAEARAAYEKALSIAKTVEPEFQIGFARMLEGKLAKP